MSATTIDMGRGSLNLHREGFFDCEQHPVDKKNQPMLYLPKFVTEKEYHVLTAGGTQGYFVRVSIGEEVNTVSARVIRDQEEFSARLTCKGFKPMEFKKLCEEKPLFTVSLEHIQSYIWFVKPSFTVTVCKESYDQRQQA